MSSIYCPLTIKYLYENYKVDSDVQDSKLIQPKINGWIKTYRKQKDVSFISLNDGSTIKCLQIVFETKLIPYSIQSKLGTGVSISVQGDLIKSPKKDQDDLTKCPKKDQDDLTKYPKKDQDFELKIISENDLIIHGINIDPNPIAKTKLGIDYLRTIPHLRIRTNTFSSIARIRHQLAMATHDFFGKVKEFVLVAPPQITCNDCEGGGEAFQVTTILQDQNILRDQLNSKANKIDYKNDFFKSPAYLTVSGQLALETYCLALGGVYCYQSAFRADPSQTSRHVAEFTMLEVEIPFADLSDNMNLAQEYIKYAINHVLTNCKLDIEFLDKFYYQKREKSNKFKPTLVEYLQSLIDEDFIRLSYTDVMKTLLDVQKKGHKFETSIPESGIFDFKSEHERYLTDILLKKPVFVTNYPAEIKAFYMKPSAANNGTVECCDLLVPGIGEVLGGSSRTSDYNVLKESMIKHNLIDSELDYYLDLRKYGSIEHCGFGIGMSRLMMLLTGMENIRDMIEFPRTMGSIHF